MRLLRHFAALLIFSLLASLLATTGPVAFAQSADDAAKAADEARQRADAATGLVDEAVANREDVERQLADSITRMNELAAQLSLIGSQIDSISAQVGFADVELAGIQADIEDQAVDTYMTIVASPSFSVVNSDTVEEVMVASSVVQDVVANGRLTVSELFARRKGLEELKAKFLEDQDQYQSLQAEVDAEVEHFTSLYDQADANVASAIRTAEAAEAEYLAALSEVDRAKAKEAERERQEKRDPTTTTPTTTGPSSPPTTAPQTTTTTGGGGGSGGSGNHPPQVEQWRSLVQQFFPSNRVDEALTIIDCESNGDPNAVNPYSGASGLFQFLPATWATTAPSAGYGGYSVFDPEANVGSAAWLAGRYQELGYDYWHAWNCKRLLN
jgi:Transglycosylase SLT domain